MSKKCGLFLVGSLDVLLKSAANFAGTDTSHVDVAAMVSQAKEPSMVNFDYPLFSATDIGRLFSSSWSKNSDRNRDFREMAGSHL